MAVGDYSDNSGNKQAFIESLSADTWSAAEAPLPIAATNPSASLNGIACPASASCVAVGGYDNPGGAAAGFLETLASNTWTPTVASLPLGGDNGTLSAVSCPDDGDCVATGSFGTTQTATRCPSLNLSLRPPGVQASPPSPPIPLPVLRPLNSLSSMVCPAAHLAHVPRWVTTSRHRGIRQVPPASWLKP